MSVSEVQRSGRKVFEGLRSRGVANPEEFAALPEQVVVRIVDRFDQDETASVGALVFRLRQAVHRQRQPKVASDASERSAEYWLQMSAWLSRSFPEFDRPGWGPHPGAVIAVVKLHMRYGRGELTKARHGDAIRAGVREFDERWGVPGDDGLAVAA